MLRGLAPTPNVNDEEEEPTARREPKNELAIAAALVCGPAAMVAAAALALHGLGMPPAAIQAEGFE